jgi:hypothetical protein
VLGTVRHNSAARQLGVRTLQLQQRALVVLGVVVANCSGDYSLPSPGEEYCCLRATSNILWRCVENMVACPPWISLASLISSGLGEPRAQERRALLARLSSSARTPTVARIFTSNSYFGAAASPACPKAGRLRDSSTRLRTNPGSAMRALPVRECGNYAMDFGAHCWAKACSQPLWAPSILWVPLAPLRRGFSCVPSMIESLEVEVLYPA